MPRGGYFDEEHYQFRMDMARQYRELRASGRRKVAALVYKRCREVEKLLRQQLEKQLFSSEQ